MEADAQVGFSTYVFNPREMTVANISGHSKSPLMTCHGGRSELAELLCGFSSWSCPLQLTIYSADGYSEFWVEPAR